MDNNELAGSIACFKLEFGDHEETLIESVVSISTSSKRFIDEKPFKKLSDIDKKQSLKLNTDNSLI